MPIRTLQIDPFLELRVHDLSAAPGLTGLCVGYEAGDWRTDRLADHVFEWLPEFALKATEWDGGGNPVAAVRKAARRVYETGKFERRGEFGELLLHIAIRQAFGSFPAISKIFYKTATNDPVKGFDAVHVVGTGDELELWLGEVKFYQDVRKAIREVVAELQAHTAFDYLRGEFILILDKLDDSTPHAESLRRLLSPNVSLDTVFSRASLPVLLTYDSDCVNAHSVCDSLYGQAFQDEVRQHPSLHSAIANCQSIAGSIFSCSRLRRRLN